MTAAVAAAPTHHDVGSYPRITSTGTTPLRTSSRATATPTIQPPARTALVAPTLPEPVARTSEPVASRTMR